MKISVYCFCFQFFCCFVIFKQQQSLLSRLQSICCHYSKIYECLNFISKVSNKFFVICQKYCMLFIVCQVLWLFLNSNTACQLDYSHSETKIAILCQKYQTGRILQPITSKKCHCVINNYWFFYDAYQIYNVIFHLKSCQIMALLLP